MSEQFGNNFSHDDSYRKRSRSRSPRFNSRSRSHSPPSKRRDDRADRPILDSRKIYVSNIAYEVKWMQLKDIFKKQVGDVTYVEIFNDASGRSIGTGIVEFKDVETAQKAVDTMHQYEVGGRKMVVREERESDKKRLQRIKNQSQNTNDLNDMKNNGFMMNNAMMNNSMMGNFSRNSNGTFPNLTQLLGYDEPFTCQIFIANLDYKVDEKKLREVFRMAGRIEDVDLKLDKEGKSLGRATLSYEYPTDALQAISMFNGQMLFDRAMSIRMDKMANNVYTGLPDKLPEGLKSIGNGLGSGGMPINPVTKNFLNALCMNTNNQMNMAIGMNPAMGGMMNNMMGGNNGMNMSMGNNMGLNNNMSGMNNMMGFQNNMGFSNNNSSGMDMGSNMRMNSIGNGQAGLMGVMNNNYPQMDNHMNRNMNMGSSDGRGPKLSRPSDKKPLQSGSISVADESTSVFVSNIPLTYTWQDLKEKFRDIGEVRYAAIKTESGKSKGCGVIRFATQENARNAVAQMHGARVDGKKIEVESMNLASL